jgi:hypothetical protein
MKAEGKTARLMLTLLSLATILFGQDSSGVASATAACSPKDVNFEVREDAARSSVLSPEAGKALI